MRRAILMAMAPALLLPAVAAAQITIPFSTAPKNRHGTHLAQLEGSLFYRERIALQPDSVATVTLVDVAAGLTIATSRFFIGDQQVPVPFKMDYDPARIVEGQRYVLRAAIRDGKGAPLWQEATPFPLSFAGEPIRIMLVQAAR